MEVVSYFTYLLILKVHCYEYMEIFFSGSHFGWSVCI